MNWKQLALGPLQTNGYVIYDEKTSGIMIDPGGDGEKLIHWLMEEKITIKAILLTHAHFDHIGAVDAVRNKYDSPVYVHKEEEGWLGNSNLNGSGLFQGIEKITVADADHLITSESPIVIGNFEFQVFETPGHSPGSVSYYLPNEKIVFSGDVLFHGGVGRTDLPGGDHDTLMDSIHNKMLSLPDETTVANGHGPVTTIGKEKEINPFINGFGW
ncbi:MBL fold metallo-hydrolase [Evansella sp. AB-P1]|uniref:MBL fold metallo-hydrolase n=1 Tax=Evansella sp. AB-P1 TaxID=3037653 RepID=UPI00241D59E3|nr:MBL fold metallo-hydrolase [Evansella sp. AB-P1]MDG5788733.1 MBL fold metallo-hydrolase [Evansella sp. AB-P1]